MDLAQKVYTKLEKILSRLKALNIIQTFELKINFCQIEENMKVNLRQVDCILKKCLKRIVAKPKRAEIRNVITELVRRKNIHNDFYYQTLKKRSTKIKTSDCNFQKARESIEVITSNSIASQLKKGIKQSTRNDPNEENHLRKYFCDQCDKSFHDVLIWKAHKEEHDSKTFFECHYCFSTFSTGEEFNQHVSVHEKNSSSTNDHIHCMSTTLSKSDSLLPPKTVGKDNASAELENKKQIMRKVEEKSICRRRLSATSKQSDPPFICECGKIFRLRKSLQKHKNLKHSKNVKYHSCTICSKLFFEKGKLNRHMLSHKNNQHQCCHCSKQFARSDAMKRHVAVAHGDNKKFRCNFCQKKFTFKYNRDVHEETQHKNVNSILQCHLCGQKFRNKITLKSHMGIHSGSRISCSMCNKHFVRKSHYKQHMKTKHFGISPYQTLLDSVAVAAEEFVP